MQPLSPYLAQNHGHDDKNGMVMFLERKPTKVILGQVLRQANAKSRDKINEDIAESAHMDPTLFHRL